MEKTMPSWMAPAVMMAKREKRARAWVLVRTRTCLM
jgi:hypothetical protein